MNTTEAAARAAIVPADAGTGEVTLINSFVVPPDRDEDFRGLVGQPAWRDFPSRPALYAVAVQVDDAG